MEVNGVNWSVREGKLISKKNTFAETTKVYFYVNSSRYTVVQKLHIIWAGYHSYCLDDLLNPSK